MNDNVVKLVETNLIYIYNNILYPSYTIERLTTPIVHYALVPLIAVLTDEEWLMWCTCLKRSLHVYFVPACCAPPPPPPPLEAPN